ncbi:hypothetical protein [Brevibacillus reuszeri]|uniref:hypothetical protein n=1 Tax=Brevibacillus reuszeri TaxID=54915 RepID=UPI003D228532
MKLLWKRIRQLEIKNDINQTKMELYAVLIPTILSTEIFKRNRDIKELVDCLKFKNAVKDYLYISRTALVARIVREIELSEDVELNENLEMFRGKALEIIDKIEIIDSSEVTKFINKYSRN